MKDLNHLRWRLSEQPRIAALIGFGLMAMTVGAQVVHAQPYAIKWWSVDTGGGRSQSGNYALYGTAGQPEYGSVAGGPYSLRTGFWSQPPGGQVGISDSPEPAPALQLALRVPNPLLRSNRIGFDLPRPERARLRVYDVRGAVVSTLLDAGMGVGQHEVQWTGLDDMSRPLAAGVYFLRLEQHQEEVTRKFVFMR